MKKIATRNMNNKYRDIKILIIFIYVIMTSHLFLFYHIKEDVVDYTNMNYMENNQEHLHNIL